MLLSSVSFVGILLVNILPFPALGAKWASNFQARNNSIYCCTRLSSGFGFKISYPHSKLFAGQQNGTDGYWTQQAASVLPTCRFTPTCTDDVSVAVAFLSRHQCQFAIRGGGHMSWAGAANIEGGITIDLSAINQVSVSGDHTFTSVGGGARWEDVYLKLDAMNLAVSGGRVSEVGVGGLVTGGGNSFFAPRYGLACDNVKNFQVVQGSGKVVDANAHELPDLYRALKGGSNNLGIVTRFDLETFPQGKLWGGFVIYPIKSAVQQFQALQEFTTASGAGVDPYASVINAYIFNGNGPSFIANQYTYTKAESNPEMLQNFTDIQPQLSSTMRITNLTDLTIETGAGTPNGYRQLFGTATFVNDATLFATLFSIAQSVFQPIQNITDFQASFVLQPIPKSITEKGVLKGGNSLGLDGCEDIVWLDLTVQWSDASDDAAVNNATQCLLHQAIEYAKQENMYNKYIYLNYAIESQDPIAGYGDENRDFLRKTSRKYDPRQVFQKLVPGGFKLYRGEETCC